MKKTAIYITLILLLYLSSTGFPREELAQMKLDISEACTNSDVSIHIIGKRDKPLSEVKIAVYLRGNKVDYGFTDNDGVYTFVPENEGKYIIEAKKSDYQDAEVELGIIECAESTSSTAPSTSLVATTIGETSTTRRTTTSSTTSTTTRTGLRTGCNGNGACEAGENYGNCPSDCPSGGSDNYCDEEQDQRCDPDCYRDRDIDCLCDLNGSCDPVYENYFNCQGDCPGGGPDSVCDRLEDGICDPDCTEENDNDCRTTNWGSLIIIGGIIFLLFGIVITFNIRRGVSKMQKEKSRDDLIEELTLRLKRGEDPKELREELVAREEDPKLLDIAESRLWTD